MEAEIKWSKPIKSYYGVSQYQTLHGIFCNDIRPETESYIGFTSLNNNGSSDRWGNVQERCEKLLLVCLPGGILASYCFNTPWHTIKEEDKGKEEK